jgi:subtilisin
MRRILFIEIIVIFALSASIFIETCFAQQNSFRKRVLIGFKGGKGRQEAENRRILVRNFGGEVRYSYRLLPAVSAQLSDDLITKLKNHPNIAYVENDIILHTVEQETPWGVEQIDANQVWSTNTGEGVDVAILDTGIDYDHPDLVDNIAGGIDYSNERRRDGSTYRRRWNDIDGHGTHCAGIVAASDNDFGTVGVAPGANLWAVKVLGDDGTGYLSDVIQGLQWCADNGIEIGSMSFGTEEHSQSFQEACDEAYEEGVLLVAAAGNDGSVIYPAAYDSVVAVSATNASDNIASFSSTGPEVEISAPGVNIYSTYTDDRYATWSGTSMACPHVSGVAALLYAADGLGLTSPDQIRDKLRETAIDLGAPGKDDIYGYGRVNATATAVADDPPVLTNIEVSPSDVNLFVDETQQFTATGTDQYGDTINIENITWENSDDAVGTVDSTGLFRAIESGTTTVSASSESITGIASVTVVKPPTTEQFSFSGTVEPKNESIHTIFVQEPAIVYVKLTWNSRYDLSLRIYDSTGEIVEEVDESSRREKIEEITTLLETGDWEIAVKSESRRRLVYYNIEVTINY